MLTSKAIFYEFPIRKKIWGTFTYFVKKNVLCEKGDEITRFDGTYAAFYHGIACFYVI
jgi:hypothetical protein